MSEAPKRRPGSAGSLGEVSDIAIWRNTPASVSAKTTSANADYDGRGHRRGEPVPLYGADPQQAADDEFLHAHPVYADVEIRSTKLTGSLFVVDASQDAIAAALGSTPGQLSDPNDRSICQRITSELFAAGVQALRLPSARANSSGSIVIVERSAALELLREEEIVYRTITVTA